MMHHVQVQLARIEKKRRRQERGGRDHHTTHNVEVKHDNACVVQPARGVTAAWSKWFSRVAQKCIFVPHDRAILIKTSQQSRTMSDPNKRAHVFAPYPHPRHFTRVQAAGRVQR